MTNNKDQRAKKIKNPKKDRHPPHRQEQKPLFPIQKDHPQPSPLPLPQKDDFVNTPAQRGLICASAGRKKALPKISNRLQAKSSPPLKMR